jgi:hypothetical protein
MVAEAACGEADNLEDVKEFRGRSVHNIFCCIHYNYKYTLEKQFYLRIKSILKSKLNGNNLIKAVYTYAVPVAASP